METESFKQGEKTISKDNSEGEKPVEPMFVGRNVFPSTRIRRSVRYDLCLDGEAFRKSLLAYNWCILCYISPVFYIYFYITQKV